MIMKVFSVIILTVSIMLVDCSCFQDNNKIMSIAIGENSGVGPNAFLIVLEIADDDLMAVLKRCECRFLFSPPLEELNTSSIRCFKISEQEVHIQVVSTLWSDLSSSKIREKEDKLSENKITLEIIDSHNNSWVINN